MNDSEEIKSRLDIVDVVREYLQLQQAGGNFKARCPFHQEKSPSFIVSPDKQIWHCFGCGKGGDMFSFVQEIEGLTFPEALRILAPKAGVTLKRINNAGASKRNKLLDILDLAKRYYNKILLESPRAEAARKYLEKRGLSEDQIIDWQIGFSFDSWDGLMNFLKQKRYSELEIFEAGLSAKSQTGNKMYDRFRDRIMFPISDVNGNTLAFTARVSPEKEESERQGKYINSPQSTIYDKSKVLFGLDKAKFEIRSQDQVIVVEGQMDAITTYNHGFKNVVASSGTALTTAQIKLLKRFTKNIDLAFDMDEAGQQAVDRGIREASNFDMNISVVKIPNGKDPDDCIRRDVGEWRNALQEAKPIMEFYYDSIFRKLDLSKVEDKRQGAKEFLSKIVLLGSKIDQDFWLKKLSEKIDVEEYLLRETLSAAINNKKQNNAQSPVENKEKVNKKLSIYEILSENLLSLAIKHVFVLEYLLSHLEVEYLWGGTNQSIYKKLILFYNNNKESLAKYEIIDYNEFRKLFIDENLGNNSNYTESQLKSLDRLVLLVDKEFHGLERQQIKEEVFTILKKIKKFYYSSRMKDVERQIMQAEKDGNEEKINKLLEEFKFLSDEYRELN